jgi:hypothetical protein
VEECKKGVVGQLVHRNGSRMLLKGCSDERFWRTRRRRKRRRLRSRRRSAKKELGSSRTEMAPECF